MSRCFLLRLSRFLALSDTDDDGAIDDGASEDVGDDEIAEALCDRRARVRRRVFRLFFCCCYSGHFLSQKLETKLQTESRKRPCIRLHARSRSSLHICRSKPLSHTHSKLHICTKLTSLLLLQLQQRAHPILILLLLMLLSKLN